MMTDKDKIARDIRDVIETDIREKLLGPGYAKDIIVCSDDCIDEIIPEAPRNAYRVGIIPPGSNSETVDINEDEQEQYNMATYTEDCISEKDPDSADSPDEAKILNESVGEPDDSETISNTQANPMSTHIGLIACVSSADEKVDIEISYGTYSTLSWKNQIEEVKVKTGKFSESIQKAIVEFDKEEKTRESLGGASLNDIIEINNAEKTISLSPTLNDKEIPRIFLRKTSEYAVEAELIKTLFSKCFKRTHHAYSLKGVACNQSNQVVSFENDDNIRLYIDSYEAAGKRFLSVILRSVSSQYIYQPIIEVRGNLVSYTEPISSIEDDHENAINEFLYRKVNNYGKGVNCAVNWDQDAKRIYTTFTPIADVEKFTNVRESDSDVHTADNQAIAEACTLRNLSIWSQKNILELLRNFVAGYGAWHKAQCGEALKIEGFDSEKRTILDNQQILLKRLNENVDFLKDHPEALECFKIANTAMLMQMIVARHPAFKKNRDLNDVKEGPDFYNNLKYFENGDYLESAEDKDFKEPSYYPFQLAFLLINVKPTFNLSDPNRKIVDLIWFPTGGGKTEAYLALTALTIVARRRRGQVKGVSVIMRYTLRLLTTQQFERATYLISALDFLRKTNVDLGLGKENESITIGLYVGGGVTPNRKDELKKGEYKKYFDSNIKDKTTRLNNNPFPIAYCPWCGSRLVAANGSHGYLENGGISCMNLGCSFSRELPLKYIDENIYSSKPTLLFATVDKFAQLYSSNHAELLRPNNDIETPDLIIQDEMHLLVGALGSIVGFYESIIEKLCSKGKRFPKIIAATATTRNTSELIKKLYDREAAIFPPQGLDYSDNYFSLVEKSASKRRHIGLISAECVSSNMTEIRLTTILVLAKVKIFKKYIEDKGLDWRNPKDVKKACDHDGELAKELDNYWSTVLYFNSLKDLGRSRSRVSQEIFEGVRSHQYLYSIPNSLAFLRPEKGFYQRVLEFTSRIDSARIKSMLTQAETRVHLIDEGGVLKVKSDAIDLVFASNMISVGIDISRWNLLVMVGQPRSTSEYIQSSSRSARTTYGLVVNLMNPRRIREHSLFENYVPFHRTFYKGVEPLSITPLTQATIKHSILVNIATIYKQYFVPNETEADKIAKKIIKDLFIKRFELAPGQLLTDLLDETKLIVEQLSDKKAAQSLREIAADSYISIDGVNYQK